MVRTRSHRTGSVAVVVVLLVLAAGCVTFSPSAERSTPRETATPPTIDEDGTDVAGTDVPGLSDEDAKRRALDAEEEFLSEYLRGKSCLGGWGFSAPVVSERAVVRERATGEVVVAVRHPFWYSTGGGHGDTDSTARYTVTTETADRERRSGPEVC